MCNYVTSPPPMFNKLFILSDYCYYFQFNYSVIVVIIGEHLRGSGLQYPVGDPFGRKLPLNFAATFAGRFIHWNRSSPYLTETNVARVRASYYCLYLNLWWTGHGVFRPFSAGNVATSASRHAGGRAFRLN